MPSIEVEEKEKLESSTDYFGLLQVLHGGTRLRERQENEDLRKTQQNESQENKKMVLFLVGII